MKGAYMEYLFVHDKQGGWWLKIDSVEKLIDYHQKTNNRYEGALQMYLQGKRPQKMSLEERISLDMDNNKDWKYLQAAIIMAQNVGGTLFDGFRCLNMEFGSKELKDIQEYGACYLNCVGGSTFSVDYDNFCRRDELIFPNFQISDIRIKQFDKGQHYYAYVGDMQVRDGDVLKWNTYDEAYTRACALVGRK
jgi:hypothetical protein